MPPKAPKRVESRSNSAAKGYGYEAASLGNQPKKIQVWPEYSDADINAEKWDAAGHKGGGKDKGKSPVVQHFFDDPDGKLDLPPSIRVTHWKRPMEYILDKTPTVVDIDEGLNSFDLLANSDAASESELVRYLISEITSLWQMHETKQTPEPGTDAYNQGLTDEIIHTWKPWDHIYAINKIDSKKGPTIAGYNAHGKYAVKLWWMGTWRKIIVDDLMPFNDDEQPLLPITTITHELWPMLLCKALIKVASLDYNGGNKSCEFGDFSAIHCLTGWLPETIPLQYGHLNEIWQLLRNILPQFKLPDPPVEPKTDTDNKPESAVQDSVAAADDVGTEQSVKDGKDPKKPDKEQKTTAKGKDKAKDAKGDKKEKGKGDDKHKDSKPEEAAVPEHPEMVVFASFTNVARFQSRISALGEAADTSEKLRQNNISHQYPHPVWLKQTRDCPLERPPPEEIIPAWKLIRPRVHKEPLTDEPRAAPEPPKPIQCVEITSPYVNFKVSTIPIPTDLQPASAQTEARPSSVLERGGTRPNTAAVESIIETDENTLSPPTSPLKPHPPVGLPGDDDKPSSAKSGATTGRSKGKPADPARKKDEHQPVITLAPSKSFKEATYKVLNSKKQTKMLSAASSKLDDKKKKDRTDSARTNKSSKAAEVQGDDIVPVTPQGDDGGFSESGTAALQDMAAEGSKQEEIIKLKWMDFEMFCRCFKTLTIFHKPSTYSYKAHHTDNMKGAVVQTSRDKKVQPVLYNDEAPRFLFVDSLKTIEIIVSLTSFSQWLETTQSSSQAMIGTAIPSHTAVSKTGKEAKTPDRPPATADQSTSDQISAAGDVGEKERKERPPITAGTLTAEPHSWKSLAICQPVLRLRTTANRSAVLTLPPGRHVLKFNMSAPLGYYVNLVSTTEFTFGDEEDVMPKLKSESLRYKDNGARIISNLCKCMLAFNDVEALTQAWDIYEQSHCPYRNERGTSKMHHYKFYTEALYNVLRKAIPPELSNLETAFALRALFKDSVTPNILGLSASSRPATGVSTSHKGSAKDKKEKSKTPKGASTLDGALDSHRGEVDKIPERWVDHTATVEELVALVKITKAFRGYFVRRLFQAATPGNDIHNKTCETLQKLAAALEPSAETIGLNLLRLMFKAEPDLVPKYPFYKDEWNKIAYNDFTGSYLDQPPNTWFIVFREIFYVSEECLCVPKMYLYGGLNTCLLRVVDNDTGQEVARVFQKVAPCVYKKNKRGYTFVAEARSLDHPIVGNKWKMRLIGSVSALPTPVRSEVQSSFHTREIKDYYVPRDNQVMLRYIVKVHEGDSHLASLQLNTSKPDVYIKLQVLDSNEEVLSATGKGHVVLPSILFYKDFTAEEEKRPSSRGSGKGGKKGGKRGGSAGLSPRTGSRTSLNEGEDEEEAREMKTHKYVIQATVLRDSWPLNQSQWSFVQDLKEKEREELKASFEEVQRMKDREGSPTPASKDQKTPSGTAKPGKGKGKDKTEKGPDKGKTGGLSTSRPGSVSFDILKPHWTLRVVSDAPNVEDIEVKKDTERADEIRAMKRAWEEAEPGRAAKAKASRAKYLASHMIKIEDSEHEKATHVDPEDEGTFSLAPLVVPKPKEVLQPLDITPFITRMYDTPRYKDEEETQRQLELRQKEIQEYRRFRERVETWREDDRMERNRQKIQQIEECERLQAQLDEKRAEINAPREALRQRYLEAERKRLEELAAAEALAAEKEKSLAPSPKGKKSGKKSATGKSGKKK